MDYKEKYEMALEGIHEILDSGEDSIKMSRLKQRLQGIFPELRKSEDEETRNEIRNFILNYPNKLIERDRWLDWIEKQGEQKIADKIEPKDYNSIDPHFGKPIDIKPFDNKPFDVKSFDVVEPKTGPKFHKGDWVTNNIETVQITGYDIDYGYQVDYKGNLQHRDTDIIEKEYHLWTIQDAKDGDVLSTSNQIFIYNGNYNTYSNALGAYYSVKHNGECLFIPEEDEECRDCIIIGISNAIPATKEQCDLLFKKLKEAGYEWDAQKKEPKKIELQPSQWNISDFRTWQHIVCDVLTKYWGIGQYLDDGFCKKIAQDMQEEWNKKLCVKQDDVWNEDDEEFLRRAILAIKDDYPVTANWLRFFRQRMVWKPSKEQINALDSTLQYGKVSDNSVEHLNSLYNDLKKLKEE